MIIFLKYAVISQKRSMNNLVYLEEMNAYVMLCYTFNYILKCLTFWHEFPFNSPRIV